MVASIVMPVSARPLLSVNRTGTASAAPCATYMGEAAKFRQPPGSAEPGRDNPLRRICQSLFAPEARSIMSSMKLDSKYFDRIRTRGTAKARPEPTVPVCQWDGCCEKGTHRAPVGRNAENEYFMFCVDHVRQYNKGYNYFSGLSDGEIARYQKEALTGHRPTWTVGVNKAARASPLHSQARSGSAASAARMRDPFGFFNEARTRSRPQTRQRKLKSLEAKAFETLGLDGNAAADDIKTRYKALVKKHHPDANGGDRSSEERFRAVVQAYQLLKQSGFC
jgi:curved DNA-binding protein CbpA